MVSSDAKELLQEADVSPWKRRVPEERWSRWSLFGKTAAVSASNYRSIIGWAIYSKTCKSSRYDFRQPCPVSFPQNIEIPTGFPETFWNHLPAESTHPIDSGNIFADRMFKQFLNEMDHSIKALEFRPGNEEMLHQILHKLMYSGQTKLRKLVVNTPFMTLKNILKLLEMENCRWKKSLYLYMKDIRKDWCEEEVNLRWKLTVPDPFFPNSIKEAKWSLLQNLVLDVLNLTLIPLFLLT